MIHPAPAAGEHLVQRDPVDGLANLAAYLDELNQHTVRFSGAQVEVFPVLWFEVRIDNAVPQLRKSRGFGLNVLDEDRRDRARLGPAVVLGAVFYGLNNSSIKEASTTPAASPATTAQNTTPASPPAASPGVRDVTPRANSQPGTTTGVASSTPKPAPNPKSADPKAPPAPAPSGGTE